MIRRQVKRGGESQVELHFLAGYRTVPPGGLIGFGVNSSRLHRIERREAARQG